MNLDNKVAIITGASSGIGEATAKILASNGARVVLTARRKDRLDKLKNEIEKDGGQALVVEADVTDRSAVDNIVKETMEAFSQVDILVNNAGLMPLSFVKKLKVDEWEKMVDVNIKGVMFGVAAVLPKFLDQQSGHIINISSVAGRKVMPSGSVYCATKFAVRAFSEGLKAELSKHENIRITSIEPGVVETELTDTITDEDVKENFLPGIKKIEPLKSKDIAESIIYAVTRDKHVNVDEILITPTEQ